MNNKKRGIQDDIEYYTKLVESWLRFNDHMLSEELQKSHILVDKAMTDIEFIEIQLGFICICLQTVDAGLFLLMEKYKLPIIDFGQTLDLRIKSLLDHKIINQGFYDAVSDFNQASTYLTTYFYGPIIRSNYHRRKDKKPEFKDYDLIVQLANSTWTLGNNIKESINNRLLELDGKKKGQH